MTEHAQSGGGQNHEDSDATFELPADDPRRTDNRGGLDTVIGASGEGTSGSGIAPGAAAMGTTGANVANVNVDDDVGATRTGQSNSGQLNLNTTGMFVPDTGPVEGSASGAVAPKVEMTDVGLVDVNAVDMSLPDDEEAGAGARVEDEDGNPL